MWDLISGVCEKVARLHHVCTISPKSMRCLACFAGHERTDNRAPGMLLAVWRRLYWARFTTQRHSTRFAHTNLVNEHLLLPFRCKDHLWTDRLAAITCASRGPAGSFAYEVLDRRRSRFDLCENHYLGGEVSERPFIFNDIKSWSSLKNYQATVHNIPKLDILLQHVWFIVQTHIDNGWDCTRSCTLWGLPIIT